MFWVNHKSVVGVFYGFDRYSVMSALEEFEEMFEEMFARQVEMCSCSAFFMFLETIF